MNFLDLAKRIATETGTELESKIDTVVIEPATAYGTTTEHRNRCIRWIQQAWTEIQLSQTDWNFMVTRGRMPVVRGQVSYDVKSIIDAANESPIFDRIVPFVAAIDNKYIWMVSTEGTRQTRQHVYYIPPEFFFGETDRYNDSTYGMPSRYSIDRDGCIVFDVTPVDNDHNLEFEFRTLTQTLTNDEDEPFGLDDAFHMVIVYKGMQFYSGFDETSPQLARADRLYRSLMNQMCLRYLREYAMPGVRP